MELCSGSGSFLMCRTSEVGIWKLLKRLSLESITFVSRLRRSIGYIVVRLMVAEAEAQSIDKAHVMER